MLNVNPETVEHLMDLAREFHSGAVDSAVESYMPSVAGGSPIPAPRPMEDTVLREFRETLADLEPDQQQQVLALYWLGRDDFGRDEWRIAVHEARLNWHDRVAEYLIAHPHLADHLREGMELLGYRAD